MTLVRRTAHVSGVVALSVVAALSVITIAVTGCAGPPPALPTKVLEQGLDAVPEEHPEMTATQLAACGECHKASDAPTP